MGSEAEAGDAGTHGVVIPVPSQGSSRPDRALGRGLEDVSHLFLSQTKDPGAARVHERDPRAAPEPQAATASLVLLRPVRAITRERLGAALLEFAGALEGGLRVIDSDLPTDQHGDIDMLAVDSAHRLALIDFETTADDGLLLRGIGHIDWATRNVGSLPRMYPREAIDFSAVPRLFLVAPEFSARLQSAAGHLAGPRVHCVRFHLFETPAGTGIAFEPASGFPPSLSEPAPRTIDR